VSSSRLWRREQGSGKASCKHSSDGGEFPSNQDVAVDGQHPPRRSGSGSVLGFNERHSGGQRPPASATATEPLTENHSGSNEHEMELIKGHRDQDIVTFVPLRAQTRMSANLHPSAEAAANLLNGARFG
jgi:hypothetical protein